MLLGLAPIALAGLLLISSSSQSATPSAQALSAQTNLSGLALAPPPASLATPTKVPGKIEPLPIKVQTADRVELKAQYFPPKVKKGQLAPGVVMVHDQGAQASDLANLAGDLAKKGMGVLLLDLRGHGENASDDRNWKKSDEKQQKTLWAFASKDIKAATEFLGTRKELHKSQLILIGHGKGCSLAVEQAIANTKTLATVLIQPAEKVYDFTLKDELLELDGVPTLILCGKKDRKAMVKVQEACTPKDVDEPSCEITCLNTAADKVLEDKKLTKSIYAFLAPNL